MPKTEKEKQIQKVQISIGDYNITCYYMLYNILWIPTDKFTIQILITIIINY